jgi:catechol 2,3-dioxygenase-like lactoylglutathione lyase family enzyme
MLQWPFDTDWGAAGMIDHIGFDCNDYLRSRAFYERALAPLGLSIVMALSREQSGGYEGCGFGSGGKPEFWIGSNSGAGAQPVPRSLHVAFRADDWLAVDAFHREALAAGGRDNGPPGLRPHYHPDYYAAFVLDPDGHNVEAVCHQPIVRSI